MLSRLAILSRIKVKLPDIDVVISLTKMHHAFVHLTSWLAVTINIKETFNRLLIGAIAADHVSSLFLL